MNETSDTSGTLDTTLRFVYDGFNLIAEQNASNAMVRNYMWGLDESGTMQGAGGIGGLLMIKDSSTSTRYVPAYDGNGNVYGLIDATTDGPDGGSDPDGNLAAAYEYGPFGEPLRASGPDAFAAENPFRFSTKYFDVETGLYYYGLRYYSSTTGRFINRDPIGEAGGVNLYGFVGNDPVNRLDFLGLTLADDWGNKVWYPGGYPFSYVGLATIPQDDDWEHDMWLAAGGSGDPSPPWDIAPVKASNEGKPDGVNPDGPDPDTGWECGIVIPLPEIDEESGFIIRFYEDEVSAPVAALVLLDVGLANQLLPGSDTKTVADHVRDHLLPKINTHLELQDHVERAVLLTYSSIEDLERIITSNTLPSLSVVAVGAHGVFENRDGEEVYTGFVRIGGDRVPDNVFERAVRRSLPLGKDDPYIPSTVIYCDADGEKQLEQLKDFVRDEIKINGRPFF